MNHVEQFVPSYTDHTYAWDAALWAEKDSVPTFTYDRTEAMNALLDAYNEVKEDGPCDHDGEPISLATLTMAGNFLLQIPLGIPLPDPDPSPHGSMRFIWYKSPRHRLTIDVNGSGEVVYAALLGRFKKARGTTIFVDSVPPEILQLVMRVLG